MYPKLASLPVAHPLRKEAADVKVNQLINLMKFVCTCKWPCLLFGLVLVTNRMCVLATCTYRITVSHIHDGFTINF